MTQRLLGTADLNLIHCLFDRLLETPFFVKDAELRYLAANAAMARLCGVEATSQIIGRTARDLFPHALAERYETLDRRILADGHPIHDQLELSSGRMGQSAWLLFSRYAVRDATGKAVGVAATARQLPAPSRNHPTYARIAAVVDRIRQGVDSPLDLPGLARLAGTSRSQLERDFSRLFGTSMQSFLQSSRIERALEKLEGDASIARIAQECGYNDHSAFTRRFRAALGISPREYRRRLKRSMTPLQR